jgi:hypothetical protein
LIESFWIDENQPHDVAAFALRKFLYSKDIKGNLQFGCWNVSSIAFVLSEVEVADQRSGENNKRKRDENGSSSSTRYHRESIPFLRNGFFQDSALVHKDPDNAKILVGGVTHFEKNLKSEAEVMATAKALFAAISTRKPSSTYSTPSGKDAEILSRVEDLVNESYHSAMTKSTMNIAAVMIGNATFEPAKDGTSEDELQSLKKISPSWYKAVDPLLVPRHFTLHATKILSRL